MKRVFEFRPAARLEFDDASDWYMDRDASVRDRFVRAVDITISRIVESPASFPLVSGTEVRRALVTGFPYAIFFRVDEELTTVLSIFHTSRDPMNWHDLVD